MSTTEGFFGVSPKMLFVVVSTASGKCRLARPTSERERRWKEEGDADDWGRDVSERVLESLGHKEQSASL